MSCPFCQESIETRRVVRKKYCYVLLSNPRLMEGHLLVIPNRHVGRLSELSGEELGELMQTAIEYQEKILQKLAPGCDIRQHVRPFIPDSQFKVSHLHVHLMPRFDKDELYEKSMVFEEQVFKDLSAKEQENYLRVYRS